ncbi:histidine kinase [Rapidithrix thailandica]|uniref:Histidine kinase n=1 Tax=Rapidithrix thailandica TaxID=413964 RepID=A0AAW9S7I5_9BACT
MNQPGPQYLLQTAAGVFFFIYLFYGEYGSVPSVTVDWEGYLMSVLIGNGVGESMSFLSKVLTRWIPWKKQMFLRLISGVLVHTCATLAISGVAIYSYFAFLKGNMGGILDHYETASIKWILLTLIVAFIYSVIDFTLYSYHQYAVAQIEAERLKRKQLELQFEALKGQLSPHYLFNSLNTISSLLYKDIYLAESFIRKLAQTYQYILTTNKNKLVSLEEEVDFVKAYYFLLKVRFEDAFELKINLPEEIVTTQLPPLTLQMLVENAVKHNVISDEWPLKVCIEHKVGRGIVVSNNITEKAKEVTSFAVGLDNIKKRYQYFTHEQISVHNQDDYQVTLPIIRSDNGLSIYH